MEDVEVLTTAKETAKPKKKRRFLSGYSKNEVITAICMVIPATAFFGLFVFYPTIKTFLYSFFEYDLLTPAKFAGLANFAKLFSDARYGTVILNTVIFTAISVVLKVGLGLTLAYLVYRLKNKAGIFFMETAIFFPIIIPMSIISMVFTQLFSTDIGAINGLLHMLGLQKVPWLSSADMALYSVIIVDVWKGVGFFFIIYLVALRNVPQPYLEAADIDGAGGFKKFFTIILPCVSSTTLFLVINALITSLQIFEPVYLLTRGGPGDATNTMSYYLWQNAFPLRDIGYGAVQAIVLFLFVMGITVVQFWASKRWVHYD